MNVILEDCHSAGIAQFLEHWKHDLAIEQTVLHPFVDRELVLVELRTLFRAGFRLVGLTISYILSNRIARETRLSNNFSQTLSSTRQFL